MNDDLHRTLARLREELGRAPSVDEESRRMLQEITHDAERLSTRPAMAHSPVQRLEELALRFEAEHPTLGATLRQLVEILEKAGI
jgi:hypothetical protein